MTFAQFSPSLRRCRQWVSIESVLVNSKDFRFQGKFTMLLWNDKERALTHCKEENLGAFDLAVPISQSESSPLLYIVLLWPSDLEVRVGSMMKEKQTTKSHIAKQELIIVIGESDESDVFDQLLRCFWRLQSRSPMNPPICIQRLKDI